MTMAELVHNRTVPAILKYLEGNGRYSMEQYYIIIVPAVLKYLEGDGRLST